VTSSEIGVTAKDGVVALSGQVGTYDEKLAAEAAVRRVHGVKAIVQEIEVDVPFSFKRSDVGIATTAVARLAWNVAVPPDRISVKASKGVIPSEAGSTAASSRRPPSASCVISRASWR
jgi:osmotically-inducible protein OsmY